MTWCLGEARPESQSASHEPRVLQRQGAEQVINPGGAVEYGAAVQGAILTKRLSTVQDLLLLD